MRTRVTHPKPDGVVAFVQVEPGAHNSTNAADCVLWNLNPIGRLWQDDFRRLSLCFVTCCTWVRETGRVVTLGFVTCCC